MAFNYPLNYGQLYNPYNAPQTVQMPQAAQILPTAQMPQNQGTGGMLWVQGEAGAKAYPVAAGNSLLLMDSERQVFYIKSTDNSGIPQPLRRFVYHEDVAEAVPAPTVDTSQFITREEFENAIAKLKPKSAKKKAEVEENE